MTKKISKQPETPKITVTQSVMAQDALKGGDFYIENGLYVFTEKYLLARGYCCQNGCRHCPYHFKKDKTA